jgi:hypothetical protein
MGEEMGKVPVIGEKKKSLGIEIEAAHRIDSPFQILEKIQDGRPPPWVFDRGKIASGFIEEKNDLRFKRGKSSAVHFDVILGGIGFKTQCFNDFSIDRHPSFDHHPLGLSPRGDPGLG